MEAPLTTLYAALREFEGSGAFSEAAFLALRRVLAGPVRGQGELVDGLLGLFFERHILHDGRRRELLALDEEALGRALRHHFRQVLADGQEDHVPAHALGAHVREVLARLGGEPPAHAPWPLRLTQGERFARARVEEAVRAFAGEVGRWPRPAEATRELLRRYGYGAPVLEGAEDTGRHDPPEALRRRMDAQRLARTLLAVLRPPERELLRHLLLGEGDVEAWARAQRMGRATAYRVLARLRTICRTEFAGRTSSSRLEALEAVLGALNKSQP